MSAEYHFFCFFVLVLRNIKLSFPILTRFNPALISYVIITLALQKVYKIERKGALCLNYES